MLAPKGWPCQGCFFRACWLPFMALEAFVRPERPKRFGIRSVREEPERRVGGVPLWEYV